MMKSDGKTFVRWDTYLEWMDMSTRIDVSNIQQGMFLSQMSLFQGRPCIDDLDW